MNSSTPPANVAELLHSSASRLPERTAVIFKDASLTYRELEQRASQLAHLLTTLGVRRGERVALMCTNRPEFTSAYFGILKLGAVVVPLSTLLKADEVAYHLADSGARVLLAVTGTATLPIGLEAEAGAARDATCEHLVMLDAVETAARLDDHPDQHPCLDVSEDETAVILYTSGTTGRPKGAELRHRNIRDNALTAGRLYGCDAERPDVYLCTLPLFHSFGQSGVQNSAIAFGGTLVMVERFDAAEVLDLIRRYGVTYFAGVPTMFWRLLAMRRDRGFEADLRLRLALSGGAPLPVEIHREFEQVFGVTILEGYGLSETSPAATSAIPGERVRVGSIGLPIEGVSLRLIDDDWNTIEGADVVGEIAVRGHNVMKGYFNQPEATAAVIRDGWFRTGDLARRDPDGYYYIVDRTKDLIIRGGFNVYPRELEEMLMTHPAVSLAAVVGVAHPQHGEEVKAVLVLRDIESPPTPQAIVDWMKERVAAYKYPRIVEFRETLPMTATGKILKREI